MTLHPSSKPANESLERVHALLAPVARVHGVDVVWVRWVTEHAGRTLRVTIERKQGAGGVVADGSLGVGWGVSLDDCAFVSRDLSHALDEHEDEIPGHYSLEVSSPGLDRDIYSVADFVRFAGRAAKVKLDKPAPDGQRLLRGSIRGITGAAGAETLTMLVDGKSVGVPFTSVKEANLVFELEKGAKRAPAEARTSGKARAKSPRVSSGGAPATASRAQPTKTSKSGKQPGAKSPGGKTSGSDHRSGA